MKRRKAVSALALCAAGAVAWRYAVQRDLRPDFSVWPPLTALSIRQFFAMFRTGILARHASRVAGLAWLAALGVGLGSAFFGALRIRFRDRLEFFGFALGAGWGMLALLMSALGILGLWRPPLIMGMLICASAASAYAFSTRPPRFKAASSRAFLTAWPERAMALALAGLALFNLLGALTPETFFDALVYHLALPDLYWRHGGFIPTPWNLYSGTPGLMQMLYALGLLLGDESTANLIHWLFGAATALMIFSFGRRFSGPRVGMLAALGYYSMPLVCFLSWKAAADLGCGFYEFLAAYALALRFAESSPRWSVVAGFFTGLAMGTKYQAWPFAGVAFVVLAAGLLKEKKADLSSVGREALLFAGVCALSVGLWPLKNAVLYGDPVFPFLAGRFSGAPSPAWMSAFLSDAGRRDLGSVFGTWGGAADYLRHPWSLTFSKLGDETFVGPLFFLGLPFILFFAYSAEFATLRLLFILAWAYWSLSSTDTRYFLPSLPLATVLWAEAVEKGLRGWMKRPVFILCALVFCADLYWIQVTSYVYGLGEASSGLISKSAYLRRENAAYSNPSAAAMEFVNGNLKPDARILLLGESRGFHCERRFVASSFFDRSPLVEWLKESRSPGELRERLGREGITHFLINGPELARLKDAGRWAFEPEEAKRLLDFWSASVREVYSDAGSGCAVYEIIDAPLPLGNAPAPGNPLLIAPPSS
jgi:4-amino-4-deoxy-L-arabinose transferase-like glycosyltransferase